MFVSLLRISVEENETAEVKLPQTSAGWVGSTGTEKLSESLGKRTGTHISVLGTT